MEDGVPEVLLDALQEHDRRARAPHGRQDHGYRGTGVRIDPTGDHLRPPAQRLNESQQLPVVAETVDLEPYSREPVFDAPAIVAERINFDWAVRMQHTEQIVHGIGHDSSPAGDSESSSGSGGSGLADGRRIAISSMPIAAKQLAALKLCFPNLPKIISGHIGDGGAAIFHHRGGPLLVPLQMLRSNRLDQSRIVARRRVNYSRANLQIVIGSGLEQVSSDRARQPAIKLFRLQQHRHTVMHLGRQRISVGDDHGAGLKRCAGFYDFPPIPQSGFPQSTRIGFSVHTGMASASICLVSDTAAPASESATRRCHQ
jgi:hypothetical protein